MILCLCQHLRVGWAFAAVVGIGIGSDVDGSIYPHIFLL